MSTMIEDTAATPEITAGDRPKANKKPARAKHGAPSAPAKGKSWKKAKGAKKSFRGAKKPASGAKPGSARHGSKAVTILELLKRPGGATAQELQRATGWQPHSVRGFLAGKLRKKMGLEVVSAKSEDGERTYSIEG